MSQEHDPLSETRQFQPVDPYNIPPEEIGAQDPSHGGHDAGFGLEHEPSQSPPPPRGVKQRLTRLGPLKLAGLGTAAVIVLGGAAWGTSAALASSGSSSSSAASAAPTLPGQDQGSSVPGDASGGAGRGGRLAKMARVKITQLGAGTFTGDEGKGKSVTVVYGGNTKFGTKTRPLTADQLQVGMTVTVAGQRTGDKITATSILVPGKKPRNSAPPGDTASPSAAAKA